MPPDVKADGSIACIAVWEGETRVSNSSSPKISARSRFSPITRIGDYYSKKRKFICRFPGSQETLGWSTAMSVLGTERMMLNLCVLLLLFFHAAAAVVPSPPWKTLSGQPPLVIARGGFSGLFPESSQYAYKLALSTSLNNVVLLCDLQLTKDGAGFCHSDLRLDNFTTIQSAFPKGHTSYTVNGKPVRGWFSVDYTADQLLNNVGLVQSILSRSNAFDGTTSISMIEDVVALRPPHFWLNVEYDTFFKEHKLDVTDYILSARDIAFDYISSPEVGFLKGLNGKFRNGKTKLIFKILEADTVEPTTSQTYSSLLKDLPTIKTFASGIVVPKSYIWPVNKNLYLEPHTSLVIDAHKLGLEVYASVFANDMPGSYNYSFDPTVEYLQYIDNSDFSVDGVLTDFPPTASESIACFAHQKKNAMSSKGRPLIITHNGASGVYAGCTDLAYEQAVEDGADILDCSVQMSKDGVAFCLGSADLTSSTTALTSFMSRSAMVPEIQDANGIFSFDLTWSEIQTLKPKLASPLSQSGLVRNPAAVNQGNFMTLVDFLDFAKNNKISGILIKIENAAYLASSKGLGIVDAVSSAMANASYDKQTSQQVLIQSDDSSVLSAFKKYSGFKRVLHIVEAISSAENTTLDEIKTFADAVTVCRSSVVTNEGSFASSYTDVVKQMHAANISVYISVLENEFMTIAFDFFSDPMIEIATYAAGAFVDGIITEFPSSAVAYFSSPCSDPNANLAYTILPAEPGSLLPLAAPEALPPAEAPAPVLKAADVVDPPLPPVADHVSKQDASEPAPAQGSDEPRNLASTYLILVLAMLSLFALNFY